MPIYSTDDKNHDGPGSLVNASRGSSRYNAGFRSPSKPMPRLEQPTKVPDSPGFSFALRVYYEDTDAGGVVYYANYLKFFERARTEWLRNLGISQEQLARTQNLIFVVRSTEVQYHRPARLDYLLTIKSHIKRLGRVSVEFQQEAWCNLHKNSTDSWSQIAENEKKIELLAGGCIKVGCVDRTSLKPMAIPDGLRDAFQR
jgi:acyl-CoA thioester hydrolase